MVESRKQADFKIDRNFDVLDLLIIDQFSNKFIIKYNLKYKIINIFLKYNIFLI